MADAITALFVGGPNDGELLTVAKGLDVIRFEANLNSACTGTFPHDLPMVSWDFKIVEYRLLPFRGSEVTYYIYVFEGMSSDEVMERLIRGYVAHTSREKSHDRR